MVLAESAGTPGAYTVSLRVSSSDSGHFTPFEAGFSLSSASDPAKDVILRLEAEGNEETRVRLRCPVCGGRAVSAPAVLCSNAEAAGRCLR